MSSDESSILSEVSHTSYSLSQFSTKSSVEESARVKPKPKVSLILPKEAPETTSETTPEKTPEKKQLPTLEQFIAGTIVGTADAFCLSFPELPPSPILRLRKTISAIDNIFNIKSHHSTDESDLEDFEDEGFIEPGRWAIKQRVLVSTYSSNIKNRLCLLSDVVRWFTDQFNTPSLEEMLEHGEKNEQLMAEVNHIMEMFGEQTTTMIWACKRLPLLAFKILKIMKRRYEQLEEAVLPNWRGDQSLLHNLDIPAYTVADIREPGIKWQNASTQLTSVFLAAARLSTQKHYHHLKKVLENAKVLFSNLMETFQDQLVKLQDATIEYAIIEKSIQYQKEVERNTIAIKKIAQDIQKLTTETLPDLAEELKQKISTRNQLITNIEMKKHSIDSMRSRRHMPNIPISPRVDIIEEELTLEVKLEISDYKQLADVLDKDLLSLTSYTRQLEEMLSGKETDVPSLLEQSGVLYIDTTPSLNMPAEPDFLLRSLLEESMKSPDSSSDHGLPPVMADRQLFAKLRTDDGDDNAQDNPVFSPHSLFLPLSEFGNLQPPEEDEWQRTAFVTKKKVKKTPTTAAASDMGSTITKTSMAMQTTSRSLSISSKVKKKKEPGTTKGADQVQKPPTKKAKKKEVKKKQIKKKKEGKKRKMQTRKSKQEGTARKISAKKSDRTTSLNSFESEAWTDRADDVDSSVESSSKSTSVIFSIMPSDAESQSEEESTEPCTWTNSISNWLAKMPETEKLAETPKDRRVSPWDKPTGAKVLREVDPSKKKKTEKIGAPEYHLPTESDSSTFSEDDDLSYLSNILSRSLAAVSQTKVTTAMQPETGTKYSFETPDFSTAVTTPAKGSIKLPDDEIDLSMRPICKTSVEEERSGKGKKLAPDKKKELTPGTITKSAKVHEDKESQPTQKKKTGIEKKPRPEKIKRVMIKEPSLARRKEAEPCLSLDTEESPEVSRKSTSSVTIKQSPFKPMKRPRVAEEKLGLEISMFKLMGEPVLTEEKPRRDNKETWGGGSQRAREGRKDSSAELSRSEMSRTFPERYLLSKSMSTRDEHPSYSDHFILERERRLSISGKRVKGITPYVSMKTAESLTSQKIHDEEAKGLPIKWPTHPSFVIKPGWRKALELVSYLPSEEIHGEEEGVADPYEMFTKSVRQAVRGFEGTRRALLAELIRLELKEQSNALMYPDCILKFRKTPDMESGLIDLSEKMRPALYLFERTIASALHEMKVREARAYATQLQAVQRKTADQLNQADAKLKKSIKEYTELLCCYKRLWNDYLKTRKGFLQPQPMRPPPKFEPRKSLTKASVPSEPQPREFTTIITELQKEATSAEDGVPLGVPLNKAMPQTFSYVSTLEQSKPAALPKDWKEEVDNVRTAFYEGVISHSDYMSHVMLLLKMGTILQSKIQELGDSFHERYIKAKLSEKVDEILEEVAQDRRLLKSMEGIQELEVFRRELSQLGEKERYLQLRQEETRIILAVAKHYEDTREKVKEGMMKMDSIHRDSEEYKLQSVSWPSMPSLAEEDSFFAIDETLHPPSVASNISDTEKPKSEEKEEPEFTIEVCVTPQRRDLLPSITGKTLLEPSSETLPELPPKKPTVYLDSAWKFKDNRRLMFFTPVPEVSKDAKDVVELPSIFPESSRKKRDSSLFPPIMPTAKQSGMSVFPTDPSIFPPEEETSLCPSVDEPDTVLIRTTHTDGAIHAVSTGPNWPQQLSLLPFVHAEKMPVVTIELSQQQLDEEKQLAHSRARSGLEHVDPKQGVTKKWENTNRERPSMDTESMKKYLSSLQPSKSKLEEEDPLRRRPHTAELLTALRRQLPKEKMLPPIPPPIVDKTRKWVHSMEQSLGPHPPPPAISEPPQAIDQELQKNLKSKSKKAGKLPKMKLSANERVDASDASGDIKGTGWPVQEPDMKITVQDSRLMCLEVQQTWHKAGRAVQLLKQSELDKVLTRPGCQHIWNKFS